MSGPHPSIFVSCVSDEFEKPKAPLRGIRGFRGLRGRLRGCLARYECDARVQEDFAQKDELTVLKLANFIRKCVAVIHLIGGRPGSVAAPKAVAEFLAATPGFLDPFPKLKAALGNFSDLTYTQWEAVLALHFGVRLRMYATAAGRTGQAEHLRRLALENKHAADFADEADLYRQLVGDLREIVPALGAAVQRIAQPRFIRHSAELFLGREKEQKRLDKAWADGTHVLCVIAWGGVGKTALVSNWVQKQFIDKQWKNCAGGTPLAYFDWSFYDQNTPHDDEKQKVRTGSVGDFFEKALTHFGESDVSSPGKGRRLAAKVRDQRTLFVLDGVEPLQQPPGSPTAGRLLDPDLYEFVSSLALANPGLLLVTSRETLTDLSGLGGKATQQTDLDDLPRSVAIRLLRQLQIHGSDEELGAASEKFGCHALSLTLLGRFLFDAHPINVVMKGGKEERRGDIRQIGEVNLQEADKQTRGNRKRSVWKVLEAYDRWLSQDGGNPQTLAVLRLTGLFDRAATAGCLTALRSEPVIAGLTEALVGMKAPAWNVLLTTLEREHLLKTKVESPGQLAMDAHPLIREFFAQQLRTTQPEAFRAAHSRLFDHLCATTEHRPDTLDGLQALYQAVVHGCNAGRYEEARADVYRDRILRGTGADGFYSQKQLGAVGADLAAVSAFFDEPWGRVTPTVTAHAQAWLLSEAAFFLRALGRLTEAGPPMRASLEMHVQQEYWKDAAINASNLSELGVALGQLPTAADDARRSVEFADLSNEEHQRIYKRATLADALHQLGQRTESGDLFREIERMLADLQSGHPLLYSLGGFRYCDWLLARAGRTAWCEVMGRTSPESEVREDMAACEKVDHRATTTLGWSTNARLSLLTIGLDHLTLAQVGLYRAILTSPLVQPALDLPHVAASLDSLRRANDFTHLPRGLLTAALYHFVRGEPADARRLLAEAQLIAERGPMPLHLADVHLHRARLFRDKKELKKAAKLIRELGYGRRYDELADAEAALGPAS